MKRANLCDDHRKRTPLRTPNKKRDKPTRNRWQTDNESFRCHHCQQMVFPADQIGTSQRNHCPYCLWSRHVDTKPGNRASNCHGGMEPVGLTFKHNGFDKYGRPRTGDVMLVHHCHGCGTLNLNRIAGDDCLPTLFDLFDRSRQLAPHLASKIADQAIALLSDGDKGALQQALCGKSHAYKSRTGGP